MVNRNICARCGSIYGNAVNYCRKCDKYSVRSMNEKEEKELRSRRTTTHEEVFRWLAKVEKILH